MFVLVVVAKNINIVTENHKIDITELNKQTFEINQENTADNSEESVDNKI